ncbi:DUF4013 domain-containing protein [Halomicrobium sp. LC1Hm]|uniref:DUF4013 domain-containing protein n=1 Tax=Halomicrobium sp. LC1Hm TaxID=2610902 RepID=UPI001298569E|nr:DUF4013 domain-containing protein [Halomicrobium sp. LC1Hm]QGA81185.1 Uncharacterized membrane protein, DUF4013 family [Halomicrobium sp. LC1Hm]
MPYCLACGTKTDFETQTCPSCGQAVRHRIDPPGDAFPEPSEPEIPWEGDDAESGADDAKSGTDDADSGAGDATNGTGAEESKPLAGIDDTLAAEDDEAGDTPPSTDPSGPSPFADRWSFGVAATYPVDEDYRPLVVGGIVELIALVLPVFSLVTVGYGFRLCGAVARGQRERPAFDDYGESLVGGLQSLLVAGLYGVVLVVGGGAAAAVWTVDEPLGIALGVTTGVLGLYPFPASLTVYAATGELRTAFSRASAGRFATSGTYVRAWLAWLAGIVAVALAAVLSVITLVGPVVVRAWGTYSLGVLWGYYYRSAAAEGIVPPAPDEPVQ